MKKSILTIIGLLLLLSGCKYEEGPFLSFTSAEKRLRGVWSVSNVYKNGEETTTESPTVVESQNAIYEFYKNKILLISYMHDGILNKSSGSWAFGDKKKTIEAVFTNQYYPLTREYEIVKFKSNELKLRFTDDDGVEWTLVLGLEYSLVPYDM